MINKIWYIQVEGKEEGPYSILQLQRHPLVTPDTLVWRDGFDTWVAARFVPELNVIFSEDAENDTVQPKPWSNLKGNDCELVLDNSKIPVFFWLIILLIVFTYVYFRLYWT